MLCTCEIGRRRNIFAINGFLCESMINSNELELLKCSSGMNTQIMYYSLRLGCISGSIRCRSYSQWAHIWPIRLLLSIFGYVSFWCAQWTRNVPFVWRICTCACVCLCAFVFNSSSVYAQCVTLGHRQTMSATAVSPLTVHFVGMLDGFLFIISDNRITLPNRMSSCTTDTIEYTTENMQ